MRIRASDLKKTVMTIRDHLPAVEAIYIFGSAVSGLLDRTSDIDLAFLSKDKPDAKQVLAIKGDLGLLLKRDIDFVDLFRADTVTKAQVITGGELLYAQQANRVAHFETVALSQYAHLNEERAEIISEIVKSGRIHNG